MFNEIRRCNQIIHFELWNKTVTELSKKKRLLLTDKRILYQFVVCYLDDLTMEFDRSLSLLLC
jgi:hypothetical protein